MLGRKLTQYIVVALLTVGFVYLGYAHVGTPSLVGSTFEEAWADAFRQRVEMSPSGLIGITTGLAHAVSQVSWLGMQLLDRQLDEGSLDLLIWWKRQNSHDVCNDKHELNKEL